MRPMSGVLLAALLMIPRAGVAQTTPPRSSDRPRVFVDVNLSATANSLAKSREFTSLFLKFGEVGLMRATYPKPSRTTLFPLVDLGGGFMLRPFLGVGVSYSRTTFEDLVGLRATIPHPTFLNAPATATSVTAQALERTESAANIFVALVPLRRRHAELRLFAGPSFFSYNADMVQDVLYAQAYDPLAPVNAITVTGVASADAKGTSVGFHGGGDFTYFFSNMFGMSAGVRFSRGTVTVDVEPLSALSQEIQVGGTQIFVGARMRFGG